MTVYQPGEDTFLLEKCLEKLDLKNKRCLEIGTGSGYLAEKMAELGAGKVEAVDINPEAVEEAGERLGKYENAEVYRSDLFETVEGVFDLVVFNPPYLPEEEKELGDEEIWSGGKKGVEVLERFLNQVEDHLSKEGFCVFIASSLAEIEDLKKEFSVMESEKLWFEELYVLRSE